MCACVHVHQDTHAQASAPVCRVSICTCLPDLPQPPLSLNHKRAHVVQGILDAGLYPIPIARLTSPGMKLDSSAAA